MYICVCYVLDVKPVDLQHIVKHSLDIKSFSPGLVSKFFISHTKKCGCSFPNIIVCICLA
jgi:hypothetical protein